MKRLLLKTFALALLCAAGINANAATKTIYSYIAGTTSGTATAEKVGTNGNAEQLSFATKYNSNNTSVTTITFANSITKDGAFNDALKLTGDFKAGDKITIQPFTQMSTSDYSGTEKYATILLYSSSSKKVADLTGSTATARTVTDGHEQEGDPKTFEYTLEADYSELYLGRGGNTRINLMLLTITREVAGGTGCAVNTNTVVANGENSDPALNGTSGSFTTSGTWASAGEYSFTLVSTATNEYVRPGSASAEYKINGNTAILLNKGTNGIYNITKSDNVKSVTVYAKRSDDNTAGTLFADFGLGTQTQLSSTLPARSGTAESYDITAYSNIRVAQGTYVVFEIEYTSGATLTVADINWASLYLPFAVTIPDGMKVYYASNVTSSKVTLTEITGAIPAETGVVVNAESNSYNLPIATAVDAIEGNKFTGVTEDTDIAANSIYVLSGSNADKTAPKFALYSPTSIGANKAFIDKAANGIDALELTFEIGDVPTAIGEVGAEATAAKTAKYFDGKQIVIVKDGKKYSAAGVEIK